MMSDVTATRRIPQLRRFALIGGLIGTFISNTLLICAFSVNSPEWLRELLAIPALPALAIWNMTDSFWGKIFSKPDSLDLDGFFIGGLITVPIVSFINYSIISYISWFSNYRSWKVLPFFVMVCMIVFGASSTLVGRF